MKTRPFTYWNSLACWISLALLAILSVTFMVTDPSLIWLVLVLPVLQYLFMAGVYIGKWYTERVND